MSHDENLLRIFGNIDTQRLLSARNANGTKLGDDPSFRAFEVQMNMMNRLFDGGEQSAAVPSAMTGDYAGDTLMYDALATLSRLFSQRAGLQAGQDAATAPKPEPLQANSVRVKVGASEGQHDTGRMKADNTTYEVVDGKLSAVFESGKSGSACIGYDRVGGTSYGTYQIASRTGSMDRFIGFLRSEAPELAERLSEAGPANTGSKRGAMPREWRRIAEEEPIRFEKLQRDFIKKDHYTPARNKILAATGIDLDQAPQAVREVLWSTSVQHGATGAARIFTRAIGSLGGNSESNFEGLVSRVYDSRKGQFGSSSSRVRNSVHNRLSREEDLAISMLTKGLDQLV